MSRLRDKQEAFCQEYLKDLNGTAAAIRVGYGVKGARRSATRMLATPAVKARVEALMAERAEATKIDAAFVVKELTRNASESRERGDYHASNRALELLGRHLAMFTDKLNVDFRDVATLSDEELEAEARELRLVS